MHDINIYYSFQNISLVNKNIAFHGSMNPQQILDIFIELFLYKCRKNHVNVVWYICSKMIDLSRTSDNLDFLHEFIELQTIPRIPSQRFLKCQITSYR